MHNTDTHTDDEQPQGSSDDSSGEVKINRDMCLSKAINRSCSDKLCWRKHDAESIEEYKAALGTNCWEMKKQWWKARQMRGR